MHSPYNPVGKIFLSMSWFYNLKIVMRISAFFHFVSPGYCSIKKRKPKQNSSDFLLSIYTKTYLVDSKGCEKDMGFSALQPKFQDLTAIFTEETFLPLEYIVKFSCN